MWLQLFTIGYCLTFLFNTETPWVIVVVLLVMVVAASWIALNEVQQQRRDLFFKALLAISLGGGITLAIIIFGVLQLLPWYQPQFIIPLSGMIFANAMNAISLADERFNNELAHQQSYQQAVTLPLVQLLYP
jgi:putative ABC transport system permease protein